MRRAVHPKFGRGAVVGQERRGEETFFVIEFPGLGRKKLAARFVQIEEETDLQPPLAEREVRSATHESAIARAPGDVEAYRAYGQWLVEQDEEHGELLLLECDPPSGLSPRADRETHARDVKRLTRKVLAPFHRLVPETRAEYTLKRGFVSHLNVLVAAASELVAIVHMVHRARVTALIEALQLPPPADEGDLTPLWEAWRDLRPFPHLKALSIPSPGARGPEFGALFAGLTTLAVKRGHELRLPPLPRVSMLSIEDASPECIVDVVEGAPRLHAISLSGPELRGDMLRTLVARRAAFAHVQVSVVTQRVQGFGADDMRSLRRAFPRAMLLLPDITGRSPPKRAQPKRPDPPVDLEAAMIDGEPRPLRRVLDAMRGKEGTLVVRDALGALRVVGPDDTPDETLVSIAHAADLSEKERAYFAGVAPSQPIEQLTRAVYVLAPHRAPLTVHPLEDLTLRAVRALWRRGWEADFDDDDHDAVAFATEREFSAAGLTAHVPHRPVYRAGADVLEPVDLEPAEPEGLVFLGERREPVPLGTVPARIFSETMRDLRAVEPAPTKRRAPAPKRPAERVDRLFDRLVQAAADLDMRTDVNAAVAQLSPDGQRLVALVAQGKVPSDDAIARTLGIAPEAADALLDEIIEQLFT